jgi:hypothetical protein
LGLRSTVIRSIATRGVTVRLVVVRPIVVRSVVARSIISRIAWLRGWLLFHRLEGHEPVARGVVCSFSAAVIPLLRAGSRQPGYVVSVYLVTVRGGRGAVYHVPIGVFIVVEPILVVL